MNVYGHQGMVILKIARKKTYEYLFRSTSFSVAVVKNDPYIDIGQSGVKYSTDGEHYFFLDVLPWCQFYFCPSAR